MTKRNITIVGIILILIAIIIIVGRRRAPASSTEVRESVALNVGNAVVDHSNLAGAAQRELTEEVGAPVNTFEVKQAVAPVARLVEQGERGVELAVVWRAVVPLVNRVQVSLV